MDEQINLLIEITNQANQAIKLLTTSEIAIENGDLQTSLNCTKEVKQLLKTMFKDTFLEYEELFGVKSLKTTDYNTPTPLELAKSLSNLGYNATSLLSLLIENKSGTLTENLKTLIAIDLNTVKEIVTSIYDN